MKEVDILSTGIMRKFYSGTAWKKTRDAFFNARFGLCEDCGSPGEIVHHVDPICAADVRTNPEKCLGWDNLKLLCRVCHELHHSKRGDRLSFDAEGNIIYVKGKAEDNG
jgi:5-methylcytosine-specific restriction endonuclease McrA